MSKRGWKLAVISLVLCIMGSTQIEGQFRSKDQFITVVKQVFQTLPMDETQSIARESMVRDRILVPRIEVSNICESQRMEDWRRVLEENLSSWAVNRQQLASYLYGVDAAFAEEVRKGGDGRCPPRVPFSAVPQPPPPAVTEKILRGNVDHHVSFDTLQVKVDWGLPKQQKKSWARHWWKVGLGALVAGGVACLTDILDCERDRNHNRNETNVDVEQGSVHPAIAPRRPGFVLVRW